MALNNLEKTEGEQHYRALEFATRDRRKLSSFLDDEIELAKRQRFHHKIIQVAGPKTKSFLDLHPHLLPIRADLHPAMLVRAQQGRARQGLQGLPVGQSVGVVGRYRKQE